MRYHRRVLSAGLRDCAADTSGGLSTFFALTFPVLLVLAGGVIDTSVAYFARSDLQSAVDSAALAAASSTSTDPGELAALADQYFAANLRDQGTMHNLSGALTIEGEAFRYEASGQIGTSFLQMIGLSEMDVGVAAQAVRRTVGAEIVMVLDKTGSMGFGSSWSDAKAAMYEMLQGLDDYSAGDDFYATLMPMADRINVGTDKGTWMTVSPAPGDWDGCFEPREEAHVGFPFGLSDQPPSVQRFLPTANGYHISDLADEGYFTCPEQVLGPTDDVASIQSEIDSLTLSGTGRFDEGMAWAWRMLSPSWRDLWSVADYPSDYGERRKIVVFITDMYTQAYHFEVGGEEDGNVFGYNQGSQWGFEHFVHVCDLVKDEGIEIHTVYVNGNTHGVPYMQQCATDIDHYHEVTDVTALQVTLDKIASEVIRVALVY